VMVNLQVTKDSHMAGSFQNHQTASCLAHGGCKLAQRPYIAKGFSGRSLHDR
jgi:hypothetical protein